MPTVHVFHMRFLREEQREAMRPVSHYLVTCFERIFRSAFLAARLMSAAETPSIRLACLNSWGLIGCGFRETPFPSRSAITRNAAIRPNGLSLAGIRYQGANFVDVSS